MFWQGEVGTSCTGPEADAQNERPISRATPPSPSPRRIPPSVDDIVLNQAGSQPSSWDRPFGAYKWMK
jgi:hypothetical protein